MGPRFSVSSKRLEKPGVEIAAIDLEDQYINVSGVPVFLLIFMVMRKGKAS